jgi:phosphoglycerate dehydrogenase-like enzyme
MIVLLESIHPDGEQILRDAAEVVLAPDSATMPDVAVGAVTAIVTRGLGRVSAGLIESLPALRVIARCGAGLDNIDVSAAHDHGVTVVYAPGVTAAAVSEHAMMLALCLARQTVWIATATAAGAWAVRDGLLTAELRGRTMGVVGLGAIGTRVAMLGTAFGMQVVGWSRHHRDTGVEQVELDDLVASCDLIQLCVALAPETARLIDARRLSMLRPGALVVNTARGGLVDVDAVAVALDEGPLGGYATDVWDPEPPRAGTPLLAHPRVLVTPHVAAFTDRTYRDLAVGPATAVAAILRGDAPDERFVRR